mmetsp:Transcript_3652/g.11356  ORF Transcript_3652/g.11356 Transcript_3652/m.11356 type:complete len:211 (+) Transcript_3652:77-709(+)
MRRNRSLDGGSGVVLQIHIGVVVLRIHSSAVVLQIHGQGVVVVHLIHSSVVGHFLRSSVAVRLVHDLNQHSPPAGRMNPPHERALNICRHLRGQRRGLAHGDDDRRHEIHDAHAHESSVSHDHNDRNLDCASRDYGSDSSDLDSRSYGTRADHLRCDSHDRLLDGHRSRSCVVDLHDDRLVDDRHPRVHHTACGRRTSQRRYQATLHAHA